MIRGIFLPFLDIPHKSRRWNTVLGDQNHDPAYDLDDDGAIDIVDVMLVAAQ
jgi:hypothetical protein